MAAYGEMAPVGVTALKEFLGTVDEDRDDAFIDEVIPFCRLSVACLLRDCFCRRLLVTWLPRQMVSTRLSSLRRSSLTTSIGSRWLRQARKASYDWRFACTRPRTVRNHMCCGYAHFFQCGRWQVMQIRWHVCRLRNRPPMQGQKTSKPVEACMLSAIRGHALCRQWNMMAKFMGKQRPLEKVNLAEQLGQLCLDQFYGSETWPELASVRELKSKIRTCSGDGFANSFVFADLRK